MMWGQAGGESAEPCWALLREKGAMPCYKCLIYLSASRVPPIFLRFLYRLRVDLGDFRRTLL